MYTVQWWLNHVDEGELTNTFFTMYPINYEMTTDLSRSIQHVQNYEKLRFLAFLFKLRTIGTAPGSEEHIFFAVQKYQGGEDVITTCLCRTEDLCANESPETLSWLLVDLKELLSYWVADTELTQQNILHVLSKILYIASFLGYSEKYRDLYREIQSKADPEDAPVQDSPEGPDAEAEAWKQEILRAELCYNEYCFQREIASVRASLPK